MNNPTIYITILFSAFGVSELSLALIKRAKSGASVDRGSLRRLGFTITPSIWLGVSMAFMFPQFHFGNASSLYIVGPSIFVIGAVLRWYSIIWLGKYFTVNVAIASDHKVIDTGPYRFVRHPSYTGLSLEFIGLTVCIGSWFSMAIILIPIGWALWLRIKVEEAALRTGLDQSYIEYSHKTKRLIPFVF